MKKLLLILFLGALLPGFAGAQSGPADFARAVALIEAGQPAEAHELLVGLRAGGGVDAFDLKFQRARAALRWSQASGNEDPEALSFRPAAVESLQVWSGSSLPAPWPQRARRELALYGGGRSVQSLLSEWERHPDIELATREYHDLLLDLLNSPNFWQVGIDWPRVWDILKRSSLAPLQILEVGRLLESTQTRRGNHFFDRFGEDLLQLLEIHPDRGFSAHLHLRLAEHALRQGEFESLLAHLDALEQFAPLSPERRKRAKRLRADALRPEISLSLASLLRPGSKISLSWNWRNIQGLELQVEKLPPADHLNSSGEVVLRRSFGEASTRASMKRQNGEVILDSLPMGLYRFRLKGDGGTEATQILCISRADLVLLGQEHEVSRWWVANAESGQPIAGARARLYDDDRLVAEGRTDREGRLELPRQSHRKKYLVVLDSSEGPSYLQFWSTSENDPASPWRAFLWSDRPMVQPGETLTIEAVVRVVDDAERRLHLPKRAMEFILEFFDAQGQSQGRQTMHPDERGRIEAQFKIDEGIAFGSGRIQLMDPKGRTIQSLQLTVEEPRLPEFRVHCRVLKEGRHAAGDSITVEVRANQLSGEPLRGSGTLLVRRGSMHFPYPMPRPMNGFGVESRRIMPPVQSPNQIAEHAFSLSSEGIALIRVELTPVPGQVGLGLNFEFEGRVRSLAQREETGGTSLRVHPVNPRVDIISSANWVGVGEKIQFELKVASPAPEMVDQSTNFEILRFLSPKKDGSQPTEIVALGEATAGGAPITFSPREGGRHLLRLVGTSDELPRMRATLEFLVQPARAKKFPGNPGGLTLLPRHHESDIGASAEYLLLAEEGLNHVLVQWRDAKSSHHRVVTVSDGHALISIPLPPTQVPLLQVRALGLQDFRSLQAFAQVRVRMVTPSIDLKMRFAEKEARPGSKVQLLLEGPASAAGLSLSLTVVDAALLDAYARPPVDPALDLWRFPSFGPPGFHLASDRLGRFQLWSPPVEFPNVRMRAEGRASEGMAQNLSDRLDNFMSPSPQSKAMDSMEEAVSRGASGAAPKSRTRREFASLAHWQSGIVLDEQGRADVEIQLPDNLTEWEALVVGVSDASHAAIARDSLRATQPILVRLQTPRVPREKDRFLSVLRVTNQFERPLQATIELSMPGFEPAFASSTLSVPARGSLPIEWAFQVPAGLAGLAPERRDGELFAPPKTQTILARVETELGGDALEIMLPVAPFGAPLQVGASGISEGSRLPLDFQLPSLRHEPSQQAVVTIASSVLASSLPALRELAILREGHCERLISSIAPAVAVYSAANAVGLSTRDIDPTLEERVRRVLHQLKRQQHGDGGWSWWGWGSSNPYLSAYVVQGLVELERAGVKLPADMLMNGARYLRRTIPTLRQRPDDQAMLLYALAAATQQLDSKFQKEFVGALDELSPAIRNIRPYTRALLVLAHHEAGMDVKARELALPLKSAAVSSKGGIHWGLHHQAWYRADGSVEATAFALRALIATGQHRELWGEAARWLLRNREGHRWDSSRSTAHALLALADYARGSGELGAEFSVVATLNGAEVARHHFATSTLAAGEQNFALPAEHLKDGANQLVFRLEGKGRLYAGMRVESWSSQEDPEPTAHRLSVQREVFRLQLVPTLSGTWVEVEETLQQGDRLARGDRLRVKLKMEAEHDVEFVRLVDPLPAGAIPEGRESGRGQFGRLHAHRELHPAETIFWISEISAGSTELVHEIRVESAGRYWMPPARANAHYLPIVGGSSRARWMDFSGN